MSTEAPVNPAPQDLLGKVAVITGSRRGIGAATAIALAQRGCDIVGNYVDEDPKKGKRNNLVVEAVEKLGRRIKFVRADITTTQGRLALRNAALDDYPEGIDYLILNAAGGLEDDKPDDWAETINIHAQVELVWAFLGRMRPGGKIIYPTSHWAHRYGEVEQLPGYEPVAMTKHKAEAELRGLIPDMQDCGQTLGIVNGTIIKGTGAYVMFKRTAPEKVEEIRQLVPGGEFPDAEKMAEVTREMIVNPISQGEMSYVGGDGSYLPALKPVDTTPYTLDRNEVTERLPMYGESKLNIDGHHSPADKTRGTGLFIMRRYSAPYLGDYSPQFYMRDMSAGVLEHQIAAGECEGHFGNELAEVQLYRAVDQTKLAALSLALTATRNLGMPVYPSLLSIGSADFLKMLYPDDKLKVRANIDAHTAGVAVVGSCEIYRGEDKAAQFKEVIVPLINHRLAGANLTNQIEAIEAFAQELGLVFLGSEPGTHAVPLFRGFRQLDFYGSFELGDRLTIPAAISKKTNKGLLGDAEGWVNGMLIASIKGIDLGLAPNKELALRMIRMQRPKTT